MARTCENCGAAVKSAEARYCEFCGAELPRPETPAPPARFGDVPGRFAALETHADLGRLMRLAPSALPHQASNVFGAVFALVFLGVAGVVTVGFMNNAPAPMALIPLIAVGAGVALFLRSVFRGARLASEPLQHRPALVVDERTQVSGGSGNSSSHTTYYVTLQTKDGDRREYEANGKLAGHVAPGDMGLAYVKADVLLDFKRVAV